MEASADEADAASDQVPGSALNSPDMAAQHAALFAEIGIESPYASSEEVSSPPETSKGAEEPHSSSEAHKASVYTSKASTHKLECTKVLRARHCCGLCMVMPKQIVGRAYCHMTCMLVSLAGTHSRTNH